MCTDDKEFTHPRYLLPVELLLSADVPSTLRRGNREGRVVSKTRRIEARKTVEKLTSSVNLAALLMKLASLAFPFPLAFSFAVVLLPELATLLTLTPSSPTTSSPPIPSGVSTTENSSEVSVSSSSSSSTSRAAGGGGGGGSGLRRSSASRSSRRES